MNDIQVRLVLSATLTQQYGCLKLPGHHYVRTGGPCSTSKTDCTVRQLRLGAYKIQVKIVSITPHVCSRAMPRLRPQDRERALGRLQAGETPQRVATVFNVHLSTVYRLLHRFRTTGSVADSPRAGRPQVTTPRQRRAILRHHRAQPFTTASSTARNTVGSHNRPINRRTVARLLRRDGLFSRRPYRGAILTRRHRQARLNWAIAHRNWRRRHWANILFSDECRFCIDHNDGSVRVWRRDGQRFHPNNMLQQNAWGGPSAMIWGGLCGRRLVGPVFFNLQPGRGGGVNAARYINQVLQPQVVPFLARHRGVLFQQDNATPHTANATRTFLRQNNIRTLDWPAMSPDMNIMENVWAEMKREMDGMNPRPQTALQLRNAIQVAWNNIGPAYLDNLIASMPRRCHTLHQCQGGHTRY